MLKYSAMLCAALITCQIDPAIAANVADCQPITSDCLAGRVITLSPQIRKTAKTQSDGVILPLRAIQSHLSSDLILSKQQLGELPYISGINDHVENATELHTLHVVSELKTDTLYRVYRQGQPYFEPATGAVLGYGAVFVGVVQVRGEEQQAIRPVELTREIKVGDRLLAMTDDALPEFFTMQLPLPMLDGTIIGSPGQQRELAKWDIVVLNLGRDHALAVGHLLGIYRTAVPEGAATAEPIGQLMIYRVAEQTSFAIVTRSYRTARVGDRVANL